MKKNNLLKRYAFMACAFTAGMFMVQSCDDDDKPVVPSNEIQNAFTSQYPNSQVWEWDYDRGYYEADFFFTGTCTSWNIPLSNVQAEAYFTGTGAWTRTEFDIDGYWWNQNETAVIPPALRQTIQNQLGGRRLDDLRIIDNATDADYYLLEIENEPNDIIVTLDYNGNVIR